MITMTMKREVERRIVEKLAIDLRLAREHAEAARTALSTLGKFSDPESILAEGVEKTLRALGKLVDEQLRGIEWGTK